MFTFIALTGPHPLTPSPNLGRRGTGNRQAISYSPRPELGEGSGERADQIVSN
jgi:hypothetical protein